MTNVAAEENSSIPGFTLGSNFLAVDARATADDGLTFLNRVRQLLQTIHAQSAHFGFVAVSLRVKQTAADSHPDP